MIKQTKNDRNYSGGAFHKDFDGQKLSGTIKIYSDILIFDSDEKKIKIPLNDIIIRMGGANNKLIFFEHTFFPGCSVFTSERSILNNSFIREHDSSKKQIIKENKKSIKRSLSILIIVFSIMMVLLGLYQLKNPAVKFIANKIPVEWEHTLGKTVLNNYMSGKKMINDPYIFSSMKLITDPLLDTLSSEKYKFIINISNDENVNAFALPGGFIVINTALILAVDSPEELVGVLAHEIAHITLQHGLRRIIESTGMYIIISALFSDVQGILAVIADNGSYLLDRKFSRDYEREADKLGFQILLNANINPEGMVTFFKKLKEIEKSRSGIGKTINNKLSFLSTHPEPEERIKTLSKMLGKLSNVNYYTFKIDFKKFQNEIKKIRR